MKITMLGHATLLIEMDGKKILTDPWLTDPLYWGQLRHSGNFNPQWQLPDLDFVLVSHGHDDHFDPATLKSISKQTPIIIYQAYQKKAQKYGFETIFPVNHGDDVTINGLLIQALPGKHPGGLATFMITGNEGKVFFGGDSIYCLELENALKDSKPDICLMPISGGKMGFIDFHMGPDHAVQLVNAAKAGMVIPIHYHFMLKNTCLTKFVLKENCVEDFKNQMIHICPHISVEILDYYQSWER